MAKMFEVNTMKGSGATAMTAGMESRAKTRSVHSTVSNASPSVVITRLPSSRVKKCPSGFGVPGGATRNQRFSRFTKPPSCGCSFTSFSGKKSLMPV